MAPTAPLKPEPRWPPIVGTVCAALLYAFLPNDFALLPSWILPALSLLLLIPLVVLNPHHLTRETWWSRAASIVLALVLFAANQVAVVRT
ncbi:hypothetical protein, partial [Mesorhizobium japonicum]|uniref:hypothetical protein n=1 Tax=Mesorhizobium japonicum TaxID=2066070 RepID=UPI003B5B75DB